MIIIEVVNTFFFVTLILSLKRINGSKSIILNGVAIALQLYGVINMSGGTTGAVFNPAVAIA